jgi:glycosyltransferase 2 family protein
MTSSAEERAASASLPSEGLSGALLRLTTGLGILAWLGWQMDWRAVGAVLARVDIALVLACSLFYALLQVLSAMKWQLLLAAQGLRLPRRRLVGFYFIGQFFNLFLPTIVGGDAVRAYLVWRESGCPHVAASSILVERATGLVAMLVIGLVGAVAGPILPDRLKIGALALGTIGCAGLALVGPASRAAQAAQFARFPFRRKLFRFYEALAAYGQAHVALLAALGLSFVFQSGMVALHLALLSACGRAVPLLGMMFVVPAVTIASMIPVSVNGLGIREAASVYLLQQLHLPGEVGLIMALLWRVVVGIASLPGLPLWLWMKRHRLAPDG